MDTMIYSLVLTPALKDLLQAAHPGEPISTGLIGWYGGVIFSTFLIGWAVGGVFLGSLADYFGRRRILMLSIALVAGSTALAALSQSWWHLASVRFITGVGIGGLWAAGAALVAEVWPEHSRSRAAGFLQSAWGFGFFLAAALNLLVKDFGWRGFFAIGIFTLGSAWLIARYIHDSSRWNRIHAAEQRAHSSPHVRIASLFGEPYRRATWTGTGLAFVAVFGLWGATNWTPSLIQALPDMANLGPAVTAAYVSYAVMILNAGALAGYFSFGLLADRFGRKPTFALMCGGSLLMIPATFSFPHSYGIALALLPILDSSPRVCSEDFRCIFRNSIRLACVRLARGSAITPAASWRLPVHFSPAHSSRSSEASAWPPQPSPPFMWPVWSFSPSALRRRIAPCQTSCRRCGISYECRRLVPPPLRTKKRDSHPRMTAPLARSKVVATSGRAWPHDRQILRRRSVPVRHRSGVPEGALH